MRGDLDEHVGLRDVEGVVSDLAQEDGVDGGGVLEDGEHLGALLVARAAKDERLLEALGVLLQRKDVVAEDNDLVTPRLLVVLEQELTGTELLRVHHRKRDAAVRQLLQAAAVVRAVRPNINKLSLMFKRSL